MAMINKDGYYSLVTYSHDTKLYFHQHSLVHIMREPIENKYDYYYLEMKLADSFDVFPLHTFVPADIIDRIKRKEIFLVIVNFHEGFISIVDGIYKSLVLRDGIPAEQIVLGSGNYDILDEINRLSIEYNQPPLRFEWYLELEYTQKERKIIMMGLNPGALPCQPTTLNTLQVKNYPKKFLNLNRRWRLHRPMLVSLLKINNLIDHGYVSLGKSDDGNDWSRIWWWLKAEANKNSKEMFDLLDKHENEILNMPDLYVDYQDLVTNRAWHDNDTDHLYNDTLFSVITETFYFNDRAMDGGRYLTEKTFKAITCEHPFLLVTRANTLPLLKQLGYRTFHPYINESYDQETDDYKRMLMIIEEIKRLSSMNRYQINQFILACKPIVKYNLENLLSKKNWIYQINYK